MEQKIETRPFPPFLPKKATVMMMGTFPPAAEKRAMEFHYPNFQNDMWRVYGLIFFNDKTTLERVRRRLLIQKKLKPFWIKRGLRLVQRFIRRFVSTAMRQMLF